MRKFVLALNVAILLAGIQVFGKVNDSNFEIMGVGAKFDKVPSGYVLKSDCLYPNDDFSCEYLYKDGFRYSFDNRIIVKKRFILKRNKIGPYGIYRSDNPINLKKKIEKYFNCKFLIKKDDYGNFYIISNSYFKGINNYQYKIYVFYDKYRNAEELVETGLPET